MAFPHRHWSPIQRQHPASVQVANTNFIDHWTDGLRQHTFRNFHCTLLFEGTAHLRVDRQEFQVSAPCAFTIYPKETVDIANADPSGGGNSFISILKPGTSRSWSESALPTGRGVSGR